MFDPIKISQRLNDALDKVDFPAKSQGRQVKFAQALDVSQSSTNRWLEGSYIPPLDVLARIEQVFNISVQWMLFGLGDVFVNPLKVDIDFIKQDELISIQYIPYIEDETVLLQYIMEPDKKIFRTIQFEAVGSNEKKDLIFAVKSNKNNGYFIRSNSIVFINSQSKPLIEHICLFLNRVKKAFYYAKVVEKNDKLNFLNIITGKPVSISAHDIYCGQVTRIDYINENQYQTQLYHTGEMLPNKYMNFTDLIDALF